MPYDEYIGDIRSMTTSEMVHRKIGRGEALRVQNMGSNPDAATVAGVKKPKMMTGQYVPDEEHVQICLNCKKKRCKGYCSLVSGPGKKHKKKEGQEI